MRNRMAASECVTYRPDSSGQMVACATTPKVANGVAVRTGSVFGVWFSESQGWANDAPMVLDTAIELACREGGDAEVAFYGGEYCPKELNTAERALLRAGMTEGSE